MKLILFILISLIGLISCDIPTKSESGLGSLIWLDRSHYNSFWFIPPMDKFLGTLITIGSLPIIWVILMFIAIMGMIIVKIVEPKKKSAEEEINEEGNRELEDIE